MTYISGVELLYATHHAMLASSIISGIILAISISATIVFTSFVFNEKEYKSIWIIILSIILEVFFATCASHYIKPYTEYTVRIDNTVSLQEVVDTYGFDNISSIDNDIYNIIVYDKE